MKAEVFIGVDMCKPRLDLIVLPTGEILEFHNTISGIKQFVKRVKKLKPLLIACAEAELPIAVVNPKQVRDFARAILDHKMHLLLDPKTHLSCRLKIAPLLIPRRT